MNYATNTPYVKQYDENGLVTNPIVGGYKNADNSNRSSRRQRDARFFGNGKQYPLSVSRTVKYLRSIQIVPAKRGWQLNKKTGEAEYVELRSKKIEHYILIKNK